jgi:hypothetical protein
VRFEIKHRFTGSVLFSLETDSLKLCVEAAVKAKTDLRGADLRDANLRDANLRDANLRGANLRDANLRGANLRGADLRDANLRDANLRDANLRGANLRDANLRGANLRGAYLKAEPDEIARLDAVREVILAQPTRLDMGLWHGDKWDATHTPEEEHSCGTPHCLAGWLQALCPDKEIREMDPEDAGRKLAPVASALFYSHKDIVLKFLKERWYSGKPA